MKAVVEITLREDILDPAGKAVQAAITSSLNVMQVSNLRIGKYILLDIEESDKDKAFKLVDDLCKQILANPVTENYKIKLSD